MKESATIIAILDDEPEMRKALRRLLTGRGYGVVEFGSGRELLSANDPRPFNCLVLDLHMPEVNGFDILEAFHAGHIPVPIIVVTAHDARGTAERVASLGASAYLRKPVDQDVLLAAIHDAIDRPEVSSNAKN